jgi:hypothetical protein
MGILDDLKHKVEKLGDRAREGFDDARDKAGDLLDDAKERLAQHDDERPTLTESNDVGPDTTSTDAVQPGYVAAEDEVTGSDSDESSLTDDEADDADESEPVVDEEAFAAEPAAATESTPTETVAPAAELDAEELVDDGGTAVDGDTSNGPADTATDSAGGADEVEPIVEKDVDPYDEPLTETIGDEIAAALVDSEAVAEAVDRASTERDA